MEDLESKSLVLELKVAGFTQRLRIERVGRFTVGVILHLFKVAFFPSGEL